MRPRALARASALLTWVALARGWLAPPVGLLRHARPARGRPGGVGNVLRCAGAPRARAFEPTHVPRDGGKAPADGLARRGGTGLHQERRRAIAAAAAAAAATALPRDAWAFYACDGGGNPTLPPCFAFNITRPDRLQSIGQIRAQYGLEVASLQNFTKANSK